MLDGWHAHGPSYGGRPGAGNAAERPDELPYASSRRARRADLAFAAASPTPARAWGADGHRLVAIVAEGLLTPAVKAEADRLLSLETRATLASVSTWPDEVRNPASAAWHYVNFPRDDATTRAATTTSCSPRVLDSQSENHLRATPVVHDQTETPSTITLKSRPRSA